MSALLKAIELQNNAADYQFDWSEIESVFDKLHEEIDELKEAITQDDPNDIKAEFGDIMFVMANLARHLNIDPDSALEKTNTKFHNRFQFVLEQLKINHSDHNHSLKAMEDQWQKSKKIYP